MESVKYRFEESLISRQAAAEKGMLEELCRGDYTPERPLIRLNPYFISPLTAVMLFNTPEDTAVTLTVRGRDKAGDITHTFPPAREHVLPVLGLYEDCENTVELRLYQGEKYEFKIKTEKLAGERQSLISMETTHEFMQDNMIFLTPAGFECATAFDWRGDIRWGLNIVTSFDLSRLKNGNILVSTERVIAPPYYGAGLYEMTLCGKIVT